LLRHSCATKCAEVVVILAHVAVVIQYHVLVVFVDPGTNSHTDEVPSSIDLIYLHHGNGTYTAYAGHGRNNHSWATEVL
jgi:hypothetical protein